MTKWIRVPIIEEINIENVWEHPPLDYYRYGEYPRFLRNPNPGVHKWKWSKIEEKGEQ